ncbi:hypothetical protein [Chelativorans sp. AA-79]|uniref:hypothetical protein n=1 Tax=Chelativorans sp. AA-79 TaxID=3028735 RepID=UPI0023F98218|nr:hypothetical protein [Chelativorans sp. AA-79]WEX07351.1 hypothetical protein PVE73_14585 [Chelativorans sp. AA-79]
MLNTVADNRTALRDRLAEIGTALEPQICDLARKALVADAFIQMVMKDFQAHADSGASGASILTAMDNDFEALESLVIDLNHMAHDLRSAYDTDSAEKPA